MEDLLKVKFENLFIEVLGRTKQEKCKTLSDIASFFAAMPTEHAETVYSTFLTIANDFELLVGQLYIYEVDHDLISSFRRIKK